MNYSKEFKDLIASTSEDYIGHGNPNAKILFIGQEPAIDCKNNAEQYNLEIAGNAEQWRDITSAGIGYASIEPSKIEFGLPLHPWANQKFQVRSGSEELGNLKGVAGTSRTWYNYQKLINRIFELILNERKPLNKESDLDFHRLSFHTDMSAVASKKHNHNKKEDATKSVVERRSLLSSDFFRNFPIVIAAVGHFPKETYGDEYFRHLFGVEYQGNEEIFPGKWLNINIRSDEACPMLLIHTPQFSAPVISDEYLEQIAKRVVDFANEHHINLISEE